MLSGTPLDLTPFGSVLGTLGFIYWAVAAFLLWLALRGEKSLLRKTIGGVLVAMLFGAWPALQGWQALQYKTRFDESMALFNERCKSAGEKIHRKVANVDGIVWLKWRDTGVNHQEQFKLDDPYGKDCGGEQCIINLLRATDGLELDPDRKLPHHRGYRFVESIDPADNITYRYTLKLYRPFDRDPKWLETHVTVELVKERIEKFTADFGITWSDLSTRDDRVHWITGGSLRVVDLRTNEVLAERIGYMMDRGQGDTAGARSPWGFAPETACPTFPRSPGGRAFMSDRGHQFIFSILTPIK